jgi:hypothetical protein
MELIICGKPETIEQNAQSEVGKESGEGRCRLGM